MYAPSSQRAEAATAASFRRLAEFSTPLCSACRLVHTLTYLINLLHRFSLAPSSTQRLREAILKCFKGTFISTLRFPLWMIRALYFLMNFFVVFIRELGVIERAVCIFRSVDDVVHGPQAKNETRRAHHRADPPSLSFDANDSIREN